MPDNPPVSAPSQPQRERCGCTHPPLRGARERAGTSPPIQPPVSAPPATTPTCDVLTEHQWEPRTGARFDASRNVQLWAAQCTGCGARAWLSREELDASPVALAPTPGAPAPTPRCQKRFGGDTRLQCIHEADHSGPHGFSHTSTPRASTPGGAPDAQPKGCSPNPGAMARRNLLAEVERLRARLATVEGERDALQREYDDLQEVNAALRLSLDAVIAWRADGSPAAVPPTGGPPNG